MEAKEIPVVGRAAETALNVVGQTLHVSRVAGQLAVEWAIGEVKSVVVERMAEANISHIDHLVRGEFDKVLAEEQGMARVERLVRSEEHDEAIKDVREIIRTERLMDQAKGTVQVYAEHFATFHKRDNQTKMDHYAALIKEVSPWLDEGFRLEDLRIADPVCLAELRTRLKMPYIPEGQSTNRTDEAEVDEVLSPHAYVYNSSVRG